MSEVLDVVEVVDVVLGVDEVELEVIVVDSSAINAVQTTSACKTRAKSIVCIAPGHFLRSQSCGLKRYVQACAQIA
eukprot:5814566-Amphidinium_carterae.1